MKTSALAVLLLLNFAFVAAHGQIDRAMMQPAIAEFDKSDAELNAVYKKVLSQLSPKGLEALKEAQRAWLIFRDKTAEAYGTGEEGSSNEKVMYVRCAAAITRNRTKELKTLFLSDHYPY